MSASHRRATRSASKNYSYQWDAAPISPTPAVQNYLSDNLPDDITVEIRVYNECTRVQQPTRRKGDAAIRQKFSVGDTVVCGSTHTNNVTIGVVVIFSETSAIGTANGPLEQAVHIHKFYAPQQLPKIRKKRETHGVRGYIYVHNKIELIDIE